MRWLEHVAAALVLLAPLLAPAQAPDPAALYATHCIACHGGQRLGGMGPALLPQSLERLRQDQALKVIREGRAASQMPAFGDKLQAGELSALAAGSTRRCSRRRAGATRTSAPRAASTRRRASGRRARAGAPIR